MLHPGMLAPIIGGSIFFTVGNFRENHVKVFRPTAPKRLFTFLLSLGLRDDAVATMGFLLNASYITHLEESPLLQPLHH